jgi:hypothetical protein
MFVDIKMPLNRFYNKLMLAIYKRVTTTCPVLLTDIIISLSTLSLV